MVDKNRVTGTEGFQPVEKGGFQPTQRPNTGQQNNGYQPPRQVQESKPIAPPPKNR